MPSFRFIFGTFCLFFLFLAPLHAGSGLVKCEARLILGTNDENALANEFKKIDTRLTRKLSSALVWNNYYEIRRIEAQIRQGATQSIRLNDRFTVDIFITSDGRLQAALTTSGKPSGKTVIPVKTGNCLVLASEAANHRAWCVVVKVLNLD